MNSDFFFNFTHRLHPSLLQVNCIFKFLMKQMSVISIFPHFSSPTSSHGLKERTRTKNDRLDTESCISIFISNSPFFVGKKNSVHENNKFYPSRMVR